VLSVASSTLGGFAALRWTQPAGLQNQPINISFWSKLAAASDYKVELYYNSASNYGGTYTRVTLNSDVSSVSNLNGGSTQFKTFFVEQGQSFYELRIVRTAGTSATAFFTQIGVGILSQLGNGFAGQDDQSYAPTYTGFGTTTGSSLSYSRLGDKLRVHGRFTTGTVAATIASISLPTGLSIDTSKLINGNEVVGKWWRNNATGTTRKTGSLNTQTGTSTQLIYFGNDDYTAANAPATALLGNDMFNNAELAFVSFEVPIVGWSSNVTMADRAVEEYASNTAGDSDADNLTSFSNGPAGELIPRAALTGNRLRRVQFQSPVQATDLVVFEIKDTSGRWMPLAGTSPSPNGTNGLYPLQFQAAIGYGAGIADWVSSTQLNVTFGQYRTAGSTYAVAGNPWSAFAGNDVRWRVRKVSGGASVGFPVGARNIVGDVSGTAVPSGMIGENQTTQNTAGTTLSTGGITAGTITLAAGTWLLSATVNVTGASAGDNVAAYWGGLASNNADVARVDAGNATGRAVIAIRPRVVSPTTSTAYTVGAENATASRGAAYSTITAVRVG
jgi:hypothetical protein